MLVVCLSDVCRHRVSPAARSNTSSQLRCVKLLWRDWDPPPPLSLAPFSSQSYTPTYRACFAVVYTDCRESTARHRFWRSDGRGRINLKKITTNPPSLDCGYTLLIWVPGSLYVPTTPSLRFEFRLGAHSQAKLLKNFFFLSSVPFVWLLLEKGTLGSQQRSGKRNKKQDWTVFNRARQEKQ